MVEALSLNTPERPFKEIEGGEIPSLEVGSAEDLEQTVVTPSATEPAVTFEVRRRPGELAAGQIFQQKYEILAKLGSGGMGIVYKGRDLTLNRLIAIKVLSSAAQANEESILRFQREARAAGAIKHQNIVAVHEFAATDEGLPYIVMDYVDGIALADVLPGTGSLSLERCLDIAIGVSGALAFAHAKGVIHRDLKPANIMLVKDADGNERVQIVDFGIAKILTEEGKSLTQTGDVFGSPLYMSPEQCSGNRVDARSDIYSLACVLYEMLTGRPPHAGDNALATAVMHLQEEPLPLSAVLPQVQHPSGLQAVLDKAMARDAAARYQSMEAFHSDLQKLLDGSAGELLARDKVSNRQRLFNAVRQRLGILFGMLSLVAASFVHNPTITGLLYLAGGLMLVFSIPGLKGDGPVSLALQRQSRNNIPISRSELVAWIVLVPLLIGLFFLLSSR